jgi:hypothetical protein
VVRGMLLEMMTVGLGLLSTRLTEKQSRGDLSAIHSQRTRSPEGHLLTLLHMAVQVPDPDGHGSVPGVALLEPRILCPKVLRALTWGTPRLGILSCVATRYEPCNHVDISVL